MSRLQSATFESHRFNPVGPGVLIENLVEFTGPAVRSAISGDTGAGVMMGAMTSAPSVSISREVTDRTEDIVGINAAGVGSQVLQRTDVVLEAELVELTPKQLMRIHPGLQQSDWMSAAHAKVVIGTTNSAFNVWSIQSGTAGNAKTVVVSAPSGSATTVTISGTAGAEVLTIAPKTAETAAGVVAAINANTTAAKYFQAGLPITSDGTGAVATAASTPLAGGSAGSRMGYKFDPTGFFKGSDYKRNLCLCLEGDNQDLLHIWRIDNCFQTDDIDFSPDDAGGVSGVSVSFSGHVTQANYDATLGVFLPPYAVYVADLAASG